MCVDTEIYFCGFETGPGAKIVFFIAFKITISFITKISFKSKNGIPLYANYALKVGIKYIFSYSPWTGFEPGSLD